ncbi:hypothetical protein ANRL4_01623 [Anaerolineae bacterium]|nr:hypothetical protein ANRL4_01623 [Anaerolineae bacterium]
MALDMVFNDLSLRIPAADEQTARMWMNQLVQLLNAAMSSEYRLSTLRMPVSFESLSLAPSYPLLRWFNDNDVPKESRDFILSYATQYPLIQPFIADLSDDDEVKQRSDRSLAFHGTDDALGLGFTHLLKGLAISILSGPLWDTHELSITFLEEHEDADDSEQVVPVPHSSHPKHLDLHKEWIIDRNRYSVPDGKSLLRKIGKWYPHLVFSETAHKQISALGRGDIHLQRIVDRLSDLEQAGKQWIGKGFDIDHLIQGASRESPETIQEFGKSRMFKDTKGVMRLCDMHLKKIPDQWRIHFWADSDNEMEFADGRKILVGYVGKHLETKTGF